MPRHIERSDDEWRRLLTPERYWVLRRAGTEPAFDGELTDVFAPGVYMCAGCASPLFSSDAKFHSGCGWPSFSAPVEKGALTEHPDASHGMVRTEVRCATCDGHLGHVFTDGPRPKGLRYCINSLALDFQPSGGAGR
jgi:peptide-methionine (R)-S-oxide reductase